MVYYSSSAQIVAEVIKLTKAKLETPVIKAYVQNFRAPYTISAAQIVGLKKEGVPDGVIQALVEHSSQSAPSSGTVLARPGANAPVRYPGPARAYRPYPPAWPNFPYYPSFYAPYPGGYSSPYGAFAPALFGGYPLWTLVSFNSSVPAYLNGAPVYSGAYLAYAGLGYDTPVVSFNNSYPTYIGGYPVYSGYIFPGYGY